MNKLKQRLFLFGLVAIRLTTHLHAMDPYARLKPDLCKTAIAKFAFQRKLAKQTRIHPDHEILTTNPEDKTPVNSVIEENEIGIGTLRNSWTIQAENPNSLEEYAAFSAYDSTKDLFLIFADFQNLDALRKAHRHYRSEPPQELSYRLLEHDLLSWANEARGTSWFQIYLKIISDYLSPTYMWKSNELKVRASANQIELWNDESKVIISFGDTPPFEPNKLEIETNMSGIKSVVVLERSNIPFEQGLKRFNKLAEVFPKMRARAMEIEKAKRKAEEDERAAKFQKQIDLSQGQYLSLSQGTPDHKIFVTTGTIKDGKIELLLSDYHRPELLIFNSGKGHSVAIHGNSVQFNGFERSKASPGGSYKRITVDGVSMLQVYLWNLENLPKD